MPIMIGGPVVKLISGSIGWTRSVLQQRARMVGVPVTRPAIERVKAA
jgi:hypothetical protein